METYQQTTLPGHLRHSQRALHMVMTFLGYSIIDRYTVQYISDSRCVVDQHKILTEAGNCHRPHFGVYRY